MYLHLSVQLPTILPTVFQQATRFFVNLSGCMKYTTMVLHQVLLCLVCGVLPLVTAVSVHPNDHCSQALNNAERCVTLDVALGKLDSNTTLHLIPGVHVLETFHLVQSLSQISIVGADNSSRVMITCDKDIGMVFIDIAGLSFSNLTIDGCGLSGKERIDAVLNITKSYVDMFFGIPSAFSTALFIVSCADMHMENVKIQNNHGFGVTGINVVGNSILSQTHFISNFPQTCVVNLNNFSDPGGAGGGAFFLYHNFREDYVPSFKYNFTTLTIQYSTFRNNYACRLDLFTTLYSALSRSISTENPTSDYSITGAGGLSITLAQGAYHFTGYIESCLFRNNSSTYTGSGFEILQFEVTDDCHVYVNNSEFSRNGDSLLQRYDLDGFGKAGALLAIFSVRVPRERVNVEVAAEFIRHRPSSVQAINCTFDGNIAAKGGALVVASFGPAIGFVQDFMFVKNCTFMANQAIFGEAIYASEISYSGFEPGVELYFEDMLVINNTKLEVPGFSMPETGVFDINFLNVFLNGSNTFLGNQDTAMILYSAIVTMSGDALFERNTGLTGGAIHFESESYLVLNGSANVTFRRNIGRVSGGAVYVNFQAIQATVYDCFLFFDEIDQFCNLIGNCNLTNVQATVHFVNNSSPFGSAIYGSAFSNCPWGGGNLVMQPPLTDENGRKIASFLNGLEPVIVFDPPVMQGNNVINTDARILLPATNETNTVNVMPGQEFMMVLGAFDRLFQPIPLTVFSQLSQKEDDSIEGAHVVVGATDRYLLVGGDTNFTNVPVTVYGSGNSSVNVSITSDEASVKFSVAVFLTNCSKGFQFDNIVQRCQCVINETLPEVQCQSNGNITYPVDAWIGEDGTGNFTMHDCITDYCLPGVTTLNLSSPSDQCRNNRDGILCGGCRQGYSRVLGTSRCKKCPNNYFLALITLFAVLGILLVLVISFLGMTITDGYINGFIFYSNTVSVFFTDILPISYTNGGPVILFLVAFLNLDFGIETCFFSGMTQLDLVALELLFPFYLAAILLGIVLLAKYTKRPIIFKSFNATHTLATLLLLSYTRLIRTCIVILGVIQMGLPLGSRWHADPNLQYFSSYHSFLCILSIVLLIFLVPFPLLLVAPRLAFKIKTLCKLKPLIDAFTAPFDSHQRSWLGFRLLVRLLIFIIAYLGVSDGRALALTVLLVLLTILQAYLKPFSSTSCNLVDLSVVLNLTLLSVVALYLRPKSLELSIEVHYVTLGFITIFGIEFLLLLVYYILKAFKMTRRFCRKAKLMLEGMQNTLMNFVRDHATDESISTNDIRTLQVRHTSVAPGNHSFGTTEFIRYRESLLEEN